eukprot:6875985-Alexandrium_andersonii.AAC.1
MSASLVGSEMCIRDSCNALLYLPMCSRWAIRIDGCAMTTLGRCWGRVPVSYTHLTLPTICSV